MRREKGSGHAATIELSPQQKLTVTNEICALHRLHPLSWSSNYVTMCLVDVSIFYLTVLFDNCVPQLQLISCNLTRPFLSAEGVACETSGDTAQTMSMSLSRTPCVVV